MKQSNNYNLEERTAKFGESILIFCQTLKQDTVPNPLINQIVRSSTSIGANYMEANGASSRKDFQNKIYICKKEASETKHRKEELRKLWQEVQELTMIFQKITSSLNGKLKIENLNYDNKRN